MTKYWIPYTYLITEKSTGKRYYGSRYIKGCNPCELGITYFSSSEILRPLAKANPSLFKFEIRKTFDNSNPKAAREWEAKFLKRIDAANKKDWFNLSNGSEDFRSANPGHRKGKKATQETIELLKKSHKGLPSGMKGHHHSKETKEYWSKIRKGRKGPNKGKKFPASWRKHCSEGQKRLYASGYINPSKGKKRAPEVGIKVSKSLTERYKDKTKHPRYNKKVDEEGRNKMSVSGKRVWKEKKQNGIIRAWKIHPLARKWTLVSPEGREFCIEGNLELLCKQHGLNRDTMAKTLNGVYPQKGKCVGWKLVKGPRVHSLK